MKRTENLTITSLEAESLIIEALKATKQIPKDAKDIVCREIGDGDVQDDDALFYVTYTTEPKQRKPRAKKEENGTTAPTT